VIVASGSERLWIVPELGPSLGRLADPPAISRGALRVSLEDIRIGLVTGLFELAGASRSFASAGDPGGAVASLGRVAWLGLWEHAVETAAARIAAEANAGLRLAAEESRFPKKRLARLALTDDDVRAIGARLGSGGGQFVAALDQLELAGHTTGSLRGGGDAGAGAWQSALGTAARRLEAAWIALEESARREQDRWAAEIARVRGWRRPMWPVWLLTLIVVGGAGYLGLVLGGYLPVPPPLRGLAAFWWARL
jgi:hypothetical protein